MHITHTAHLSDLGYQLDTLWQVVESIVARLTDEDRSLATEI